MNLLSILLVFQTLNSFKHLLAESDEMNRFAAAALINMSHSEDQPSYKQALLTVLQQQQKQKLGSNADDWLAAALNPSANEE